MIIRLIEKVPRQRVKIGKDVTWGGVVLAVHVPGAELPDGLKQV